MRRLFFKEVHGEDLPDPLMVDWPAGHLEIDVRIPVFFSLWSSNTPSGTSVMGTADTFGATIEADLSSPPRAFCWLNAPEGYIQSIRVDGIEQIAGPLSCAVFQPIPWTREEPRAWWAWALRLWRRLAARSDDEDDDDDW